MVKAHDKLAKNSEKLLKNMEKVRKNLNFGQNRLGRGLVRGSEKTRKARRKSLEWEFARKSGGQYGVCKLWGWRKEFYCEFRWDELAQITRIKRITVLPRMARMDTDVRVRRD